MSKAQVFVRTKLLWMTSTFWWNVLVVGLEIGQVLLDARVLPTQTMLVILAIGNAINRLRTKQPASVTSDVATPVDAAPPPRPPKEPLGTPVE